MSDIIRSDVLVIGAGIAGASVADALAPECSVVVLGRTTDEVLDSILAAVPAPR